MFKIARKSKTNINYEWNSNEQILSKFSLNTHHHHHYFFLLTQNLSWSDLILIMIECDLTVEVKSIQTM